MATTSNVIRRKPIRAISLNILMSMIPYSERLGHARSPGSRGPVVAGDISLAESESLSWIESGLHSRPDQAWDGSGDTSRACAGVSRKRKERGFGFRGRLYGPTVNVAVIASSVLVPALVVPLTGSTATAP